MSERPRNGGEDNSEQTRSRCPTTWERCLFDANLRC